MNKLKEKIKILTLHINNITMNEIIEQLITNLEAKDEKKLIYTPNAEIAVKAYDDPSFSKLLNRADYLVPDGAGLLLAARILGQPLRQKVSGYDLMVNLLEEITNKEISVYFLGGEPDIIKMAVKNINNKMPDIDIAGFHHGYLDQSLKESVIEDINKKSPDILMVGMGVPLQEKFLDNNFKRLNIKIGLTVGGSFDILSGQSKRAPLWMQRYYLEWFYRFLQEPKRFKRMLALPKFLYLVLRKKFTEMYI